jgi:hypothetical protein
LDTCERDARSQDRRPQKNTMLTEQFGRFSVHDYVGSGGMAMFHRATFDGRLGTSRDRARADASLIAVSSDLNR